MVGGLCPHPLPGAALVRALVLLALLAAPAPGQSLEPLTDTGRRAVEDPIVEFKKAPFRTERRPELIDRVETAPQAGARLRKLDKMTGASETLAIAAGERRSLGRLTVAVEACLAPESGAQEGTRAFVKIWDAQAEGEEPAFSGWMFADSPALSALDHPRFDVWVISCTTS